MSWLYYLLEANLYLIVFYSFYRLFLYQETFYNSNRCFLLVSSLIAFTLPVLQLGFLKPSPIVDSINFSAPLLYDDANLQTTAFQVQKAINFTDYVYLIYLFIAFYFVLKLVTNLYKITRIWLKAKKTNTGKVTVIELHEEVSAFSFFNLLFIHPHLAAKQTVLKHEMIHIKQRHSFDIIFFELIQIICWFNPIIYFMKRDVKLLHEYIADKLSIGTDMQKHEYALFLIENSFGITTSPLTNQIFNQSILKRRINMLNKKRTAARARLRLLLVLPLTGAMLCISTMAFTKDYGYIDLLPEKSNEMAPIQENPKVENLKKQQTPKVENLKRDQVKFPPPPAANPAMKGKFYPKYGKDKASGKVVSKEKRYILINEVPVKDLNTFYGVSNADEINYLNYKASVAKYGNKAKHGAIEITGKNISYYTKITLPPPPREDPPPPGYKRGQVKFPPPKINGSYRPVLKYDSASGKMIPNEKKLIVINNEPLSNNDSFYGVVGADEIIHLKAVDAIKKYGETAGKNGAIEIIGKKIQGVFPPPVIKLDQFNKKKRPTPSRNAIPKEDVVKLIQKLPPLAMVDKETNLQKNVSKEDLIKLVQKLPSVMVNSKKPRYEFKSDQKLPLTKIVID